MKILLDECLDHRFRKEFTGYYVTTVSYMGWDSLKNGALLKKVEHDFDVFMTADADLQKIQ